MIHLAVIIGHRLFVLWINDYSVVFQGNIQELHLQEEHLASKDKAEKIAFEIVRSNLK
jgi:hypothetical protein